jgi:hypothetical protein
MNRRKMILSAAALPALLIPFKDELMVPKGIRFLGRYPKVIYYQPNNRLKFAYHDPKVYYPAPISLYENEIFWQYFIGWNNWEII